MKKIIFFFLLLISAITLKAQYVEIPDSNFRNSLQQKVPGCFNANGLLDTTCTSLSTITSLNYDNYSFGSTAVYNIDIDGVQYLKSLQGIQVMEMGIYNFSQLPASVSYIALLESGSYDTIIKFPENLQNLTYIGGGGITSSTILPKRLKYLVFFNSRASQLPSLPDSLGYLDCSFNSLTSLPALPSSLTFLDCSTNSFLLCLPKLPNSLDTLHIDSIITCLPNLPPHVLISQYFYSHAGNSLPVCNSSNNPHGCTIYNTCTWIGTIDSIWEKPGNWSCNTLPDSTTDVIINSGKVVITSDPTIKSLQEGTGAQVIVTSGYNLTILQ